MCRAYLEAEHLARRALDLQPDYLLGLMMLGMSLTSTSREAEAIPVVERAVALSRASLFVGMLGTVYGIAGRTDDLTQLEHELEERCSRREYVTPASFVLFGVGRGDGALIRCALEDCVADHMPFTSLRIVGGPFLDTWRTDVTIDELLQRLGDGVPPPEATKTRP